MGSQPRPTRGRDVLRASRHATHVAPSSYRTRQVGRSVHVNPETRRNGTSSRASSSPLRPRTSTTLPSAARASWRRSPPAAHESAAVAQRSSRPRGASQCPCRGAPRRSSVRGAAERPNPVTTARAAAGREGPCKEPLTTRSKCLLALTAYDRGGDSSCRHRAVLGLAHGPFRRHPACRELGDTQRRERPESRARAFSAGRPPAGAVASVL